MGSSTASYKKADYGNFNEYIVGKIKSARDAAAEERKYADDRIENLSKKEERTEEEEQLLKQLVDERSSRKKGSFFGKALSHEFGGDLLRRTRGTFSSNPSETEDPASSKRQRFSALIRGDIMRPQGDVVSPEPMKQLELPLGSEDKKAVKVEDVGLKQWLSSVFDGITKNNTTIAKSLNDLNNKNEDQTTSQDKSSSILSKIVSSVDKLKNHFDKNNKLQQDENNINAKQLDLNLDSQNQQEMSNEAASIGKTQDVSDSVSYNKVEDDEDKKEKGGGNILGKIFDVLPIGRRFKALKRLGGRRLGGFGKMFGGGKASMPAMPPKPMAEGGMILPSSTQDSVQPTTGIVNLPSIQSRESKSKPQGANSQPIKMSSGGSIVGQPRQQRDITQNNSEVKRKLAEGGVFDNPTPLTVKEPGSFIPLYRNNPLRNSFTQMNINNKNGNTGGVNKTAQGKGFADPLAKIIQLPTMAAGGLLLSTMTSVFQNLGGIGKFLKPFLDKMMGPIATVFGLPTSILGSMFGGAPAQAATLDSKEIADFLSGGKGKKGKKGGSGGGGGGGNPPTPPGGADLGASMRPGETITAQSSSDPGGFIQGGSGLGSEGGQNTNKGYATHWHLSPPSNDEAGFAQARAVAFTSAKMMLARGSTIYFGNLKQNAVTGDDAKLQQQIAAEQRAHTQPGRTQGGIDMQEKSPTGNMALKFPLKVTNVSQDINSGSGRTARVQGTNVRLAHGAKGSANSVESAAMPAIASSPALAPPALNPSPTPVQRNAGQQGSGSTASGSSRQTSTPPPKNQSSASPAFNTVVSGATTTVVNFNRFSRNPLSYIPGWP